MFKNSKTEDVRAKAFFEGAQPNVNQADALKEIEAAFDKKHEEVNLRATDEIKTLEAKTEIANQRKTESEEHWKKIDALTESRAAEFAKPSVSVLIAVALVIADGRVISSVMDVLNITELWEQWLVATIFVVALSGLIEIAIHNFHKAQRKLWLVIAPAALGLTGLIILGWWRGEAEVFAGLQRSDGVMTFAAANPILTKTVLAFVTVALPIVAAFFFHNGVNKLRLWLERKRARNDFLNFSKELEKNKKLLEAANEKRDHELERVKREREEWLAAARDAFNQGSKIGAHKKPMWQVLFFIAVVGILTFVVVMVFGFVLVDQPLAQFIASDVFRFALFLLLVIGLTGLFAIHAVRKWNRPTAEELLRERVTHWRNAEHPDALRVNGNTNTHKRLPTSVEEEDLWNEETIVTAR
jgi:hypothetical protein